MFQRIVRDFSFLAIIGILLQLASALPQWRLAAQAAPSNGVAKFTPSTLSFGAVPISTASATQQISLSNTGTGPLGTIALSVTNSDYAITNNTCPATLAVNSAACTITISLTPSFEAPDPGGLVVTDDSSAGSTTALLSGTGVTTVYVLPFEIFYDGQAIGSTSSPQTATFTNAADAPATITSVTNVGNAPADFLLNSACGATVVAGGNCTIGVTFKPATAGPRTADLTVATSSPAGPFVAHLTGNGAIRHLPGFTANILPQNDDNSSNEVPLPFGVNFFGTTFNSLFVNNNGNVTFGEALSDFTPTGLNSDNGGIPIIAAYWADVDTSGAVAGGVETPTIPSAVVTYGVDTVNGHPAFGVDYENVGYYDTHTDKLNSFQLILIDRSDTGIAGAFDIEFDYDKIQWESGDASNGIEGLCGGQTSDCVSAAAGYSNGTGTAGTNLQLPGSFVPGALLDNGPMATSLIHQALNGTMPGRTTFAVRNGTVQSADLSLTMTQSASTVPAGSNLTYTLTVANTGPNDTTNVIVTDVLPTMITLVSATPSQGAACNGTTTLTCNLGTVANGGNATLTIVVTIATDAVGTVTNSASVVSDLPDPNMANNTATVTATITSAVGPSPALAITKSHTGNFTQGQHSAQYTVTVSNAANAAASNGTVTVTDTTLTAVAQDIATSFSGTSNPNGLWSYGQYVEAPPAFSLLTGQNAGFPTCGLPYWSDSGYPDVIANNSGSTVTCGTVTVPTDMLWLHPTNTGGTDAVVRWTAPARGTYEITGSYSALDSTSTTDSILVNGTSVFSTFICNPGNGKTCNTVNTLTPFSVVETLTAGSTVDFTVNCCTLPGQTFLFDSTGLTGAIDSNLSGLSLAAMFGQGWTCGPPNNAANVCTRSDALAPGSSYPPITVLANVGVNAPSPQTNTVTLSGGGSASNSASDSATINPIGPPLLAIAKSHTGNFTQGQQNAQYMVKVSNGQTGGLTSGTVTVVDTIPAGLTLVSMAGTNWACVANSCTRSDALPAGTSYPAITVTVNVASNAAASVVNAVSVSGGGSATANATDPTTIGASSNVILTITEAGNGAGTVTSNPAGISCQTACTASFASGTPITLTATPTNGATFAGWGAGPCEGTETCTFTITAATTVVANFTAGTNNFALTVTEAGTGNGSVNSTPAGINCPETCSAGFPSGTQVTLMQSASEGSTFAGWSGGCTGSTVCVVTMTAAKAVTATFNSSNNPVTITVPSGGSTTGTTTPGGTTYFGLIITCAPAQTGTVTLTATTSSNLISVNLIPNTVVCPGGAQQAVKLQTFCQGSTVATGSLPGGLGGGGIGLFLATMMFGGFVFRRERRAGLAFAMVLMMVAIGIGACASLPKSPTGQATPPGTYFISLTTMLNGQAQTLPNFLTLVVK